MRCRPAANPAGAGTTQHLTEQIPPTTDIEAASSLEDAARTILFIRDIEVAAARIALAPSVCSRTAERMRATPITNPMGIANSSCIRSMANIVAKGNGAVYFTTAEPCHNRRNRAKHRIQVWRLPTNHQ